MALASVPRHNLTREDIGLIHALNYGSARTDVTLQDALTAIGVEEKTLLLTPGTWTIASHRTIPDNIRLMPAAGTVISVNTGITLTINGPIEAPPRQLFAGAGSVVLGRLAAHPAYGEWFGAKGDGATDDTAALSKTQDAVGDGGWIKLIAPEYRVTQWAITKSDLTIEGRGSTSATGAVRIIGTSNSLPVIHINGSSRSSLKRLFVNHSGTADTGVHAIRVTDAFNTTIEDVSVWADFAATPTSGSYGGLLIEAVNGETYDTHLIRVKATNTRGNGLTLVGSAADRRVGETYINECMFSTNAGAGGDLASIYVGDYVYGVYPGNRTTTFASHRHSVLIWPTAPGRTVDIIMNDVVLDSPQHTNVKARNTSSISISDSWIGSPTVDGWGVEQVTALMSLLYISGNRIGENFDGGVSTNGNLGLIVDNIFLGHTPTSQLALYFGPDAVNNYYAGNHFMLNANNVGNDGADTNVEGPNYYDNNNRASMTGVNLGPNFALFQNPTNPVMLLDDGDALTYNRAGNAFEFLVGSAVVGITSAAGMAAERFYGNLGATAWNAARFTLSAGWGTAASVSAIVATDSRGYFTVNSAGTGQGVNPTVTITFADAAWAAVPTVLVNQQTGLAFVAVAVTDVSTTGFVVTILATPANGGIFNFAFLVMG